MYYDLWVPNNHHAQHFPMDILRYGPPRLSCTMRWEAANQVLPPLPPHLPRARARTHTHVRHLFTPASQVYIRAGRATNFKSLLVSMAEKVGLRRAQDLLSSGSRLQLQVEKTLTENVSYGVSNIITSMWDGGILSFDVPTVEVTNLHPCVACP